MRKDRGINGDAQRIEQLGWMLFLKILDDQDEQLELLNGAYRSPIPDGLRWRDWAADPEGVTGEELLTFVDQRLFPSLKEAVRAGQNGRARVVRSAFEDANNYMKSGQLIRQVINQLSTIDFNDLSERQHFGDIYEQILNDLQSAGNAGEFYTPRAVTTFMARMIDPKPGEVLLDPACGTGGFLTCAIRHMRATYVKTVADEERMRAALRATEVKQLPYILCATNLLLNNIEDPSFVRHDNMLKRPYVSYGQADRVDIVLTNPPFGGDEEDGVESNFPRHLQTRETADLFLALILRLLKPGGRAAVVLPDGSLYGEGVKTRLKEQLLAECNLHTVVRLPNSVFKPYAAVGTNLLFFEKGAPTKDIWFYEHRVPPEQKAYSMTKPIRVEHLQDCIDWWGGPERTGRIETEVAWKVAASDVSPGYNLDIKNPHVVADDHGDPLELLTKLDESEARVNALGESLRLALEEALLR
jgi:type I restriction enzyme M protein